MSRNLLFPFLRLLVAFVFAAAFILTTDFLRSHFNQNKLSPVVKIDVGKIQGVVITQNEITAEYFVGVPFAEPPIGENRFEVTILVSHYNFYDSVKLD